MRLVFDALDDDQQPRVLGQHRVAGAGGGGRPVASLVAAAPAGLAVRLVVQVDPDHGRVVGVPAGQQLPVGDPVGFGDRSVYQSGDWALESGRCRSRMTESPWARARADDPVHQLQRRSTRPVRDWPGRRSPVVAAACRHSLENGSRTVLKPNDAIWASPSSRPICHSPCGAQFGVSIPNQATALITYGRPSAVLIVAPSVCSQPTPPDA